MKKNMKTFETVEALSAEITRRARSILNAKKVKGLCVNNLNARTLSELASKGSRNAEGHIVIDDDFVAEHVRSVVSDSIFYEI